MRRIALALVALALLAAACSEAEAPPATADITTDVGASSTTALGDTSQAPGSTSPTASSTTGPPGTVEPGVPRFNGEAKIVDYRQPITLNPYVPGGDAPVVAMLGQIHLAGVYDIDPDTFEPVPELVTQLPNVENGGVIFNADGTMDVTWNLRPEATWSDGEPITGRDMEFTLEYREATQQCTGFGTPPDPLPEIETLGRGDKTFTARFATASLDYQLLFPWLVPEHAVVETDFCEGWNTQMWPAAGPFTLKTWVRDGPDRYMEFDRNENYWKRDELGRSLPYLDRVRVEFAPDAVTALARFTNRSVDVISPPASVNELVLADWRNRGADVQIIPGLVWEHLNFQFGPANRNPASLNGLLEFRRAIAYAIDRRRLLDDAGHPMMSVIDGFLTRFTRAASTEPWSRYAPDQDQARQLLAEACAHIERDCGAEPIRVVYSSTANDLFRQGIATQVQAQLAEVGIQVELELEDSQSFFGDTLSEGTWDVGNWAWAGDQGAAALVDFFRRLAPSESPPDGANVFRWGSAGSSVTADDAVAQFNDLLERMRASADPAQIRDLARQAEELVADQVVLIPITARPVIGAAWSIEIRGFRMNPTAAGPLWNVEYWYEPTP